MCPSADCVTARPARARSTFESRRQHGIAFDIIPEEGWMRLYVKGLSPEQAASTAGARPRRLVEAGAAQDASAAFPEPWRGIVGEGGVSIKSPHRGAAGAVTGWGAQERKRPNARLVQAQPGTHPPPS